MKFYEVDSWFCTKRKYSLKKQKYFINNDGVKYNVDGKYVVLQPTRKEIEVAKLLGQTLGGKVNIIPRINYPPNIKTPDYTINNERFDLKEIKGNSKNTLYDALSKQRRQANNFIFDITNTEMTEEEAINQIKNIYHSKHKKWVNTLILIKNNKVVKIYKRG